jgi:hypothetical protein
MEEIFSVSYDKEKKIMHTSIDQRTIDALSDEQVEYLKTHPLLFISLKIEGAIAERSANRFLKNMSERVKSC